MAALRSRCGHYIFALWFLLSSIIFPRSVQFFRGHMNNKPLLLLIVLLMSSALCVLVQASSASLSLLSSTGS